MGKTYRRARHDRDDLEEIYERKAAKPAPSVQAVPGGAVQTDNPLIWWVGASLSDYIPISEYGTAKRQKDLQAFALIAPMILNAEAAVLKKAQSLEWQLTGGRNVVYRWQDIIANFENGEGWNVFIARWIRSFLECDYGGFAEIIRSAPSWAVDRYGCLTERGMRAMENGDDAVWPVVGAKVLDPTCCELSTSSEFPVIYTNPRTGRRFPLRNYNYMRIVDMPSPSSRSGVCAVSRAVRAAQLDNYINKYFFEKLSENPGAGIAFVNASQQTLETALRAMQADRKARGVAFYKGVAFIPVLNPEGNFSAEFINFSGLPDGFSHLETYNIIKEVVATAFGLDVLELGSIPGGNLGTATQATEASEKASGKVIGSLIAQIERELRMKVLPERVEFTFRVQDVVEEYNRARLYSVHFDNATKYAAIAGQRKAEQYLVDVGVIPASYIEHDLTDEVVISDTSGEKASKGLTVGEKLITSANFSPGHIVPLTDAEITPEDIDRAIATWDELFDGTDYVGILDARRAE